MELISKTEDENDLLYLYSAVIRIVFNDRIEEEEIEQLDVAEVISTFKAVAEIVDASVNEIRPGKRLYRGTFPGRNMGNVQKRPG